jgi:hypothetical protein
MRLFYLGAEVPSNRLLLGSAGATAVGFSYWRASKRGLPKTKTYLLANYFPDDMAIFVHPGIPKNQELERVALEEFAADYEEFIINNIDRITYFTEISHRQVGPDFIRDQRDTVWGEVPPAKFLPVWRSESGQSGLEELAERYLDISIPGEAIEESVWLSRAARGLKNKHETRLHAMGTVRPDNLRQVPVETASTMSWLSPMTRGETIVWDGTRLVRYPKSMKEQARPRHKAIYEKANLSFEKIVADDVEELCKLAVWSFDQLETRLSMTKDPNIYDSFEDPAGDDYAETLPAISDRSGVEMRKLEPRKPEEMVNLPVFGFDVKTIIEKDDAGNDVLKDVPVVQTRDNSLRQCDTCFVAQSCPAFKPQNTCAFKLPVEVKTKEQLKSLINAIIEMQGQRVAFMRFAEEMNGGYADPNVSQEIDRLFKLIKTTKELDDSREFIRMTVERQGSAGVLSQIFGEKAQILKELPNEGLNEDQTTQIIKGAIEE